MKGCFISPLTASQVEGLRNRIIVVVDVQAPSTETVRRVRPYRQGILPDLLDDEFRVAVEVGLDDHPSAVVAKAIRALIDQPINIADCNSDGHGSCDKPSIGIFPIPCKLIGLIWYNFPALIALPKC